MKRSAIGLLMAFALFAVCACSAPPEVNNTGFPFTGAVSQEAYGAEYYSNRDYQQWNGAESVIPDQWEGYGIGDPQILRHNGMYYLYCSSLNNTPGIRGYKSANLVDWVPCDNGTLPLGFVHADDNRIAGAYAPEVIYWDGYFYMYTQPGGNGNYILRSTSPEGPFEVITDNFGLKIDTSVFIDDDERMYFLTAGGEGIEIREIGDPGDPDTLSQMKILDNALMGRWTEGPFCIKRDGTYYLTYTGDVVTSHAYRVSYAVSDTKDGLLNKTAFTAGAELPIILNGDDTENFGGLGHSASVLGPDMDSYYISYHNLNSAGGPNRSLNIDRLLFNGKQMTAQAKHTNSIRPKLPAFYAYGAAEENFTEAEGFTLAKAEHGDVFSAEYNFSGTDDVRFVFDYRDAENYSYVAASYADKTVRLYQVAGGAEKEVPGVSAGGSVGDNSLNKLSRGRSAEALHTVRLAYRDGEMNVYFDDLLKIPGAKLSVTGGKIGYYTASEGLAIGYTALSDVAGGLSDEREIKQANAVITANNYLPDGYIEGVKGNAFSGASGKVLIDDEASEFKGAYKLRLENKNDFATYPVTFDNKAGADSAFLGLEMTYPTEYGGTVIGVQLDNETPYYVRLPQVDTQEKFVKALVHEFPVAFLDKAARTVKRVTFAAVDGAFEFLSFSFVPTSDKTPVFENDLSAYVERGASYKTLWKMQDGGHYAKPGTRQLVYFGDELFTDFTLEFEMKLVGDTATSTAGVIVRADNYATSSKDTYKSIQGYYVNFNNSIWKTERLDFTLQSKTLTETVKAVRTPSDEFFYVKVVVRGNTVSVYNAEKLVYSFTDARGFTCGSIGLYTNGAGAVYRNLKISA